MADQNIKRSFKGGGRWGNHGENEKEETRRRTRGPTADAAHKRLVNIRNPNSYEKVIRKDGGGTQQKELFPLGGGEGGKPGGIARVQLLLQGKT